MHPTSTRPKITVTTDGTGVVSHAGSRLLADLADATTLTGELSEALAVNGRGRAHDPGRVLTDIAVAVAEGATTISDVAVLEHQPALFGPVASDSTCWRLLDRVEETALAEIARARAAAREVAWAQHADTARQPFPAASAAGRELPGLVLDLDASLVICHSEKEQAAPTYKGSFGYHPMLAFCDNTGEFLAAQLRRGNAGANTAADHIAVLDAALAQVPEAHRYGTPFLIRADTADCTKLLRDEAAGGGDRHCRTGPAAGSARAPGAGPAGAPARAQLRGPAGGVRAGRVACGQGGPGQPGQVAESDSGRVLVFQFRRADAHRSRPVRIPRVDAPAGGRAAAGHSLRHGPGSRDVVPDGVLAEPGR